MNKDKNTSSALLADVEEAVRVHAEALNTETMAANDARWRKDVAADAMEKAVAANDADAFAAAKGQMAAAEDDIEFAERQIAMLKDQGPMPAEEIDEIRREMKEQCSVVDAKAAKEIVKRLDEIVEIADKCEKDVREIASDLRKVYEITEREVPSDVKTASAFGRWSICGDFVKNLPRYKNTRLSAIAATAMK